MIATVYPSPLKGEINAIPSKSHAHRLLICAALSEGVTEIICPSSSEDIDATVSCLKALGAEVIRGEKGFTVTGIGRKIRAESGFVLNTSPTGILLDCGESGSTYRFLLPAACAVLTLINKNCEKHNEIDFRLRGRLPQRPMEPLFSVLESHGIQINGKGSDTVSVSGSLSGEVFSVPGNISSQYISGLLFALSILSGERRIEITGSTESEGYIDMTVNALRQFGADIDSHENTLVVKSSSRLSSPGTVTAEGDWSNSAFWISSAALSGEHIICRGLSGNSVQGDRAICDIMKKSGALIENTDSSVSCKGNGLTEINVNVSQTPDLVPAIAAAAVYASGRTVIFGGERLRLKESDRLASVSDVLKKLGADINQTPDGLEIFGKKSLDGGTVDSWGDHRIAMMAAIVSTRCRHPVVIKNAQAVKKSYPDFWKDFSSLGGTVEEENI